MNALAKVSPSQFYQKKVAQKSVSLSMEEEKLSEKEAKLSPISPKVKDGRIQVKNYHTVFT